MMSADGVSRHEEGEAIGAADAKRPVYSRLANLDYIALYARGLLLCVGFFVPLMFVVLLLPVSRSTAGVAAVALILWVVVYFLSFLFWLLLMHALGVHGLGLVCAGVLAILPIMNLLLWAIALMIANGTLQQYGVRGGILRASSAHVEEAMHTPYCEFCYYNLTGNTSGRCPECGRPLQK